MREHREARVAQASNSKREQEHVLKHSTGKPDRMRARHVTRALRDSDDGLGQCLMHRQRNAPAITSVPDIVHDLTPEIV